MIKTNLTLDHFKAIYFIFKSAVIQMEKMLDMPGFTPNRAEARFLKWCREQGIPIADVIKREKARQERGGGR